MTATAPPTPPLPPVPHEPPKPPAPAPRRRHWPAAAALVVALGAGGVLLLGGGSGNDPATPPPARTDAKSVWPDAKRADLPATLPDGPLFTPSIFLDTTTAVGTAPTPKGDESRLLLRSGDRVRELRRLPVAANPQFEAFTADDKQIFWAESTATAPAVRLWTADRNGGPARELTADTGNAVFFGNQYDLVVADGKLHWAAAPGDVTEATEIRSAPLGGGKVSVRTEPGQWTQSAWPWLVDDGSTSGEPRLRNQSTGRDVKIAVSGLDVLTCGPVWCRAMVMGDEVLTRIDLVRPDGADRRKIAGSAAQSAITDVAVLDRYEVLSEPGPDTELTGAAALVVYDITTGRTVDIAPDADGAFARGGMLWWSTADEDEQITWHTLDLRTVP
ncbi:hypothetical protein M1L60_46025 [Actinoplanes sp. TRM 88003]|uniref:Uncharacterized protein n=1 Tax=Paractinoplanes aksuensis TaxID=2939490 RepID=A0ABT1E491_9ACTN|nr:hypothetical protein [Actinoplanes aksuensis]MCO8277955.1 hypothetical protein [Actinoplanes aksuensis]